MHPDPQVHDSYVDIEPQTGMLARAYKRIQVNYQLFDTYLPQSDPSTLNEADWICGNLTALSNVIAAAGGDPSVVPQCNLTIPYSLFSCLAEPSDYKFPGGSAMVPMGKNNSIFFFFIIYVFFNFFTIPLTFVFPFLPLSYFFR
jgi:hypothetical protein